MKNFATTSRGRGSEPDNSYFRPIRSPRPSLVHTLSYWYISFRFFLSSFLRARYRVRGGKRKEGREREREGRIGAVSRESQNGLDTVSFIPLKQDRLAPRMEDNCNAVANQPCIYTHTYIHSRERKNNDNLSLSFYNRFSAEEKLKYIYIYLFSRSWGAQLRAADRSERTKNSFENYNFDKDANDNWGEWREDTFRRHCCRRKTSFVRQAL